LKLYRNNADPIDSFAKERTPQHGNIGSPSSPSADEEDRASIFSLPVPNGNRLQNPVSLVQLHCRAIPFTVALLMFDGIRVRKPSGGKPTAE
jgi:hypothetical protein